MDGCLSGRSGDVRELDHSGGRFCEKGFCFLGYEMGGYYLLCPSTSSNRERGGKKSRDVQMSLTTSNLDKKRM